MGLIYRLNRQHKRRLPRHIACDGFLGFLPKLCLQPGWARDARDPEVHSGGWTISWRWIVYYSLLYGYMTYTTYMTYILCIYIYDIHGEFMNESGRFIHGLWLSKMTKILTSPVLGMGDLRSQHVQGMNGYSYKKWGTPIAGWFISWKIHL